MVAWALLAGSILGLITGWGLLQREPWARTLAIVMACSNMVHMPFGTFLGIYTLWVHCCQPPRNRSTAWPGVAPIAACAIVFITDWVSASRLASHRNH
jgi:hypothetical protein